MDVSNLAVRLGDRSDRLRFAKALHDMSVKPPWLCGSLAAPRMHSYLHFGPIRGM
jgi:hypothetical protein